MSDSNNYKELASAPISENRNLVISEYSGGGYTLAQQMVVNDGNKTIKMFLKNTIHIQSKEGLEKLRNCINDVLNEKK